MMQDETDSRYSPAWVWACAGNDAIGYFSEHPETVKRRVVQWQINRTLGIFMALIEGFDPIEPQQQTTVEQAYAG